MTRLINAVMEGISNQDKLSKYIIIPLDDRVVEYSLAGDELTVLLFRQLSRIMAAKRDQLLEKAILDFYTKFIIYKPISKPAWLDRNGIFMKEKRRFNNSLDKNVKGYSSIKCANIDFILPSQVRQYDHQGKLSGQGYYDMWCFISDHIKHLERERAMEIYHAESRLDQHEEQRTKYLPHSSGYL